MLTAEEASLYLRERYALEFSSAWLYRNAGSAVPCARPRPRMVRFPRSRLDAWVTSTIDDPNRR